MLPLSPTDVLLIWREKNGKLYWTQTKITRNLRRYAPTKGNQEMKEKKESQIGPRVAPEWSQSGHQGHQRKNWWTEWEFKKWARITTGTLKRKELLSEQKKIKIDLQTHHLWRKIIKEVTKLSQSLLLVIKVHRLWQLLKLEWHNRHKLQENNTVPKNTSLQRKLLLLWLPLLLLLLHKNAVPPLCSKSASSMHCW